MKNLYFQRSTGEYLLIRENIKDVDTALAEISAFLNRHNYKSYYTRYSIKDDIVTFDVGSWTEFFVLAAADKIDQDKIVGTEKNFIDREEENKC